MNDLRAQFGNIDIYVFDQMLRGRITPEMRILDAGCGAGRNSHYLLRCGAEVHGVDADPDQIDRMRALAAQLAPKLPSNHFRVALLGDLPYASDEFDVVLCSAVLHFAKCEDEFERMVQEMWRVIAPGGLFFSRLASSIGIEERIHHHGDRVHRLPDGTDRFLVDEEYLLRISSELNARILDPLKTTNVQGLRAMTTWVLGKPEVS